jgi:hypothetical protein
LPGRALLTPTPSSLDHRNLKLTQPQAAPSISLRDLADPDLSPPQAVDARGRSAQTFLVEAIACRGTLQRRAVVRGQDIYAVTAPLVVEATRRLLAQPERWHGVVSAGELGDARGFLKALAPEYLTLQIE